MSFKNSTEQIRSAIGTATIIESTDAAVILKSEYINPGSSCPVLYSPTRADKTDDGDGTNNGIVNIEPICHIEKRQSKPKTFFI